MEKPLPALRRKPFVLLAATLVACSGGGAPTTPDEAPTPTATPPAVASIELLRLAPGFIDFGRAADGSPPLPSRDGRAVVWALQDGEPFSYQLPNDPPGAFREGVIYCSRAVAWRGADQPSPIGADPGCPFPDPNPSAIWYGDSWPSALSGDGETALVNMEIAVADDVRSSFGFAYADGGWEEIVWTGPHPDGERPPKVQANDMTPDAALVVGTGWLDYPHPAFSPSDARAWLFRRGAPGPTWLEAPADRIESADFVSEDGAVIVGCCDDERSSDRSLPVAWYGGAPPATFRTLPGVPEYCRVKDLSGDGRVAVGRCDARAVRWVDGEPIVIDVPRDPVPVSAVYVYEAWQVSFDGSTILGRTLSGGGPPGGWIWTEAAGTRSVHEVLRAAGIDPWGSEVGDRSLGLALAFARDGKVLLGYGASGIGPTYLSFLYRATLP